jgi:hypothetical protein
MSHSMSLGAAIGIDAAIAYGLAMTAVLLLPETRGKRLRDSAPEQAADAADAADAARLNLNSPRS